mmetsp:Transcript_21281/g.38844  ORF Transcript_21281/g.38844 Transcript_21281/m.38844 type:complete len:853 (+) Transcript_21281:41-2599(+)
MRDETSGLVLARDFLVLEVQQQRLEELKCQHLTGIRCRRLVGQQWHAASAHALAKRIERKEQEDIECSQQNQVIVQCARVLQHQAASQLTGNDSRPSGPAGEVLQRIRDCRSAFAGQVEKLAPEWHSRVEEKITHEIEAARQDAKDCHAQQEKLLEATIRREKLLHELNAVRSQAKQERGRLYHLEQDYADQRRHETAEPSEVAGSAGQMSALLEQRGNVAQPAARAEAASATTGCFGGPSSTPQVGGNQQVFDPSAGPPLALPVATVATQVPPNVRAKDAELPTGKIAQRFGPDHQEPVKPQAGPVQAGSAQRAQVPVYGTRSYEVYEKLRAFELELEADLRLLDAHVAPPLLRDSSHLGASNPTVPMRGFEPGPGPPLVHVPVPAVVSNIDVQPRGFAPEGGFAANRDAALKEQDFSHGRLSPASTHASHSRLSPSGRNLLADLHGAVQSQPIEALPHLAVASATAESERMVSEVAWLSKANADVLRRAEEAEEAARASQAEVEKLQAALSAEKSHVEAQSRGELQQAQMAATAAKEESEKLSAEVVWLSKANSEALQRAEEAEVSAKAFQVEVERLQTALIAERGQGEAKSVARPAALNDGEAIFQDMQSDPKANAPATEEPKRAAEVSGPALGASSKPPPRGAGASRTGPSMRMGALDMKVGAPKRGPKTPPPQRLAVRGDGRMPWQTGAAGSKTALVELEEIAASDDSDSVEGAMGKLLGKPPAAVARPPSDATASSVQPESAHTPGGQRTGAPSTHGDSGSEDQFKTKQGQPEAKPKAGVMRSWSSGEATDFLHGGGLQPASRGSYASSLTGRAAAKSAPGKKGGGKLSSTLGGSIDWALAGDPRW